MTVTEIVANESEAALSPMFYWKKKEPGPELLNCQMSFIGKEKEAVAA